MLLLFLLDYCVRKVTFGFFLIVSSQCRLYLSVRTCTISTEGQLNSCCIQCSTALSWMHTSFLWKENLEMFHSYNIRRMILVALVKNNKNCNFLSQHVWLCHTLHCIALLYAADVGVSLPLMPWFLYANRNIG